MNKFAKYYFKKKMLEKQRERAEIKKLNLDPLLKSFREKRSNKIKPEDLPF